MSTKLTTGEEANRFIEKVREKYLSKSEVFNLQDKTVTENGEVKADSDYYGLDTVTVNVQPELEDKTITENGTYTSEKYGFSQVNVNVVPVMEPTTVISTGTEQTINPPSGVTGFSKVTINPINLQEKNVVPNESIQEIIADTGYSGLNKVTVNKIDLQEKSVNPSTSSQEITADSNYTGLKKVTVNGIETEQKTVKSTTAEQTITPTAGKYIDSITVEALELENKTVKSTTTEQTIQPTTGKDGINEITVEALNYQEKVVNPSIENQEIMPDTGYDALSKVTVNGADLAPSFEYTYRNKSVITAEDLAGFTEIPRGLFSYNPNLVSIDIPEGVTAIQDSFNACQNLIHVGLPSTLNSFYPGSFISCQQLSDIEIKSPFTIRGSGNAVFGYCYNLYKFTYKNLPNTTVLNNNSKLSVINVAEGITNLNYLLYSVTSSAENPLYEINLPSTLTTISAQIVSPGLYSSLTKLIIPDNVTTINASNNYLVSSAGALYYISLPANISTINLRAFVSNCPKFKTIYVRGDSSCTTAQTLQTLDSSVYNNATIIYTEE